MLRVPPTNEPMPTREPSASAQLSKFLSRFPTEIVALTKRCLPKLRRALPGCHQLVYDYTASLVVSFGATDRGHQAVVALAVQKDRVRLYVDKDTPDPEGLLEGAGGKVRSVTLASAAQLDRGAVHELMHTAIRRAGVALPGKGAIRTIVKSDAAVRKQRKAKKRSGS